MANEELNPIEEIKNGNADMPQQPPAVSDQPQTPSAPSPSAPQPPVPSEPQLQAPPTPPKPGSDIAGKSAVIKRDAGGGSWAKYLILAIVILAIGAGVFYYFFYRVTFEINPSPTPDKILLDAREVKPGTYRVKPGIHTLLIQKEGFISYISARKYKFGEKVSVNFKFQPEKSPTLSSEGGRLPTASADKNFLFFIDKNSAISVMDLTNNSNASTALTNAVYPSARVLKVSKDKNFALVLDSEAIKIINFNRSDLVNQSENKLPPMASAIHSISWNNHESTYFEQANSKIVYDLQSSSSWDIFLANLSHTSSNILMGVDSNRFPSISLDWGENPSQVLVSGGELGLIDITKREYKKISSDKLFVWAKWGPSGKSAVAIDSEGGAWLYLNGQLGKLPFSSSPGLIDYIDESNIGAVSSGRPIKYNFDSKQLINYAEVKDLSRSISFITRSDVFYFETAQGIFSGRYEESGYK